jgi:hypothetical protein
MTNLSLSDHVYNRCIGALWSQGYRAEERYSDIQTASYRHSTGSSPDEIRQSAREALQALGYRLNPEAKGDYDLVVPNPSPDSIWLSHTDPDFPRAGHAVRLTGPWFGTTIGAIGFLEGSFGSARDGYTIAFGSSVFQGNHRVTASSGGPSSVLYLDTGKPQPTAEIVLMTRWRRRGYASAHQ